MTKPNYTDITVILDRSGSMASVRKDMEGGFDSFIEKQRAVPGECTVSLVQFDDQYEVVYSGKKLSDVPKMTLEPRGYTALTDAIARTIDETGRRLAAMREEDRPSQVVLMIITDGHENASTEFKRQDVIDRITHQRGKYNWTISYLGTNQDAMETAKTFGIHDNAITYQNTSAGAYAMFNTISDDMSRSRESLERGVYSPMFLTDKLYSVKLQEETDRRAGQEEQKEVKTGFFTTLKNLVSGDSDTGASV